MANAYNGTLQRLCREYLSRLRYMAEKHGLLPWVDETIKANRRHECEATKKEVEMLSRLCNDERVTRIDVPKILGKSYRKVSMTMTFPEYATCPVLVRISNLMRCF